MSLVSVIIPIYNVEKYLPKCLNSIINQTYNDLEIICVNDCSPDNCDKILEKYATKDTRVKIINRESNGGLSAARNSGLEAATGEYIYFCDSDDWIEEDYIEKMVSAIELTNVDIVLNTNIMSVKNNKIEPFEWIKYPKQTPEGEFLETEDAVNRSQVMIWAHLYKKSFLDKYNLRFPEGYIHEDEYFQHISKIHIDKLFCFQGSPYYYVQRSNGIMSKRTSKVLPYLKIVELIIKFYAQNNFSDKYNIKIFNPQIFNIIHTEEEFIESKKLLNYIQSVKLTNYNCTDYERFIIEILEKSDDIKNFYKNVGKNIRIAYMRKGITRKVKVSVIVPIYNVEPYLRKCLDSICNQTLGEIEIICINDCSPDNCLEILKEYQRNDNRVKIIDFKENKGVAIARNEGIKIAKGEYIGFVDPDDWIDLDFYEKLYTKAKECNADLVVGNVVEEYENGAKNSLLFDIVLSEVLKNKLYFNQLFFVGLYKKSLLDDHNITFIEHCIYGEDRLLPLMASFYAKNFQCDFSVYYHYFRNSLSITKKRKNKIIMDSFMLSNEKIFDFLASQSITKENYLTVVSVFWDNMLSFVLNLEDRFYPEYLQWLCNCIIPKICEDIIKELPMSKDLLFFFGHKDYNGSLNKIKVYHNLKTMAMLRKRVVKNG